MNIFARKQIYEDGTWISLQIPMDEEKGTDGPCRALSFNVELLDDEIKALQEVKESPGYDYTKDEEYMAFTAKCEANEEKENVWYRKLYSYFLEDLCIQFTPFEWRFRIKNPKFMSRWVDGVQIGPITFIWNYEWSRDRDED
jgi:hypothetical protein